MQRSQLDIPLPAGIMMDCRRVIQGVQYPAIILLQHDKDMAVRVAILLTDPEFIWNICISLLPMLQRTKCLVCCEPGCIILLFHDLFRPQKNFLVSPLGKKKKNTSPLQILSHRLSRCFHDSPLYPRLFFGSMRNSTQKHCTQTPELQTNTEMPGKYKKGMKGDKEHQGENQQ